MDPEKPGKRKFAASFADIPQRTIGKQSHQANRKIRIHCSHLQAFIRLRPHRFDSLCFSKRISGGFGEMSAHTVRPATLGRINPRVLIHEVNQQGVNLEKPRGLARGASIRVFHIPILRLVQFFIKFRQLIFDEAFHILDRGFAFGHIFSDDFVQVIEMG